MVHDNRPPLNFGIQISPRREDIDAGTLIALEAVPNGPCLPEHEVKYHWSVVDEWGRQAGRLDLEHQQKARWDTDGIRPGTYRAVLKVEHKHLRPHGGGAAGDLSDNPLREGDLVHHKCDEKITITKAPYGPVDEVPVSLSRTAIQKTPDILLWMLIRQGTDAVSFYRYKHFIDEVMCGSEHSIAKKLKRDDHGVTREYRSSLPFPGVDAYNLLKTATDVFMMGHCGVNLSIDDLRGYDTADASVRLGENVTAADASLFISRYLEKFELPSGKEEKTLPYLALIAAKLPDVGIKLPYGSPEVAENCYGILANKLTRPCFIELIWSYWQEEGMLVQAMNAISLRFQNRRTSEKDEALSRLDIDPLRPLGNLLWGYIQDEQHRLSVLRRAYEYDHHYGISLVGKAVREIRSADSRSKFLEGFHSLLHLATVFYTQDDDTTVIADGFPLLNSIREVHLVLAEGAHNQYGDLPSTARQEMLMQQWLLARPEMREFLGGRVMVPYPEPWMDRVDTVKKMFSWTDTIVTHFHELAIYGERILLSIRYGNWSNVNNTAAQAANWARFWRPEIQAYVHAYRAATGVELAPSEPAYLTAARGRAVQPSILLQKRLALQNRSR